MDRRLLPLLLLLYVVSWAALATASPLDFKHIYDNPDYILEELPEGEEDETYPHLRRTHHHYPKPPPPPPLQDEDYYYDEVDEEDDVERRFEDVREGGVPPGPAEEGAEEVYREREFSRGHVTPPTQDALSSSSSSSSSTSTSASMHPASASSSTTSPASSSPVVSSEPPSDPTRDPLADARKLAVLNIMDRLLIALGPNFGKILPKAPTNSTLATVPTPINFIAEDCDPIYKRCSSSTSFPSCEIPHNTDAEVWSQKFNMYFNISLGPEKMDIINATLRLYKNISIPLHYPKPLLIKAYAYTRSLTKKRSRTMLVAETSVSSDYIGWVTLPVEKIVRRWKKGRNNNGLVITVTDADTIPWDASSMFVNMNCSSAGLVPLPFEVQTDEEGQRYPALNIRLGSPDDESPLTGISHSPSSPRPVVVNETHIQADDPDVYEDEYDFSERRSHRQPAHDGFATWLQTGLHRDPVPVGYPLDTSIAQEEPTVPRPSSRSSRRQSARVGSHETSHPHESHHHEMSHDYLITNEATNTHHASVPHHSRGIPHHRNPDHFLPVPTEHQPGPRHHISRTSVEDTRPSHHSEETLVLDELEGHKASTSTTESSQPHRQRYSSTKERRHRRKHHHQRHDNSAAAL